MSIILLVTPVPFLFFKGVQSIFSQFLTMTDRVLGIIMVFFLNLEQILLFQMRDLCICFVCLFVSLWMGHVSHISVRSSLAKLVFFTGNIFTYHSRTSMERIILMMTEFHSTASVSHCCCWAFCLAVMSVASAVYSVKSECLT